VKTFLALALLTILTAGCTSQQVASDSIAPKSTVDPTLNIILISEVKWEDLNPARGSSSPMAANLWGDRTGSGPAGFLVKFEDGFSSPPHIHNIAYRGVVISGTIHNDDPNADEMYMTSGSYWTQPGGGVHITAAKGSNAVAYIEVEDAFGVLPAEKAFDSTDKPINVDASNIVWVNQHGMPNSADVPKVAFLWGDPEDDQLSGTLFKLPAGFDGMISNSSSDFQAVVIQGQPQLHSTDETHAKTMEPGSYFGSKGESTHQISCEDGDDCIIYVRMDGKLDIRPADLIK